MLPPHFIARAWSVCLLALVAGVASAQGYPNKPIRLVTSEPGSGTDFVTRLIAQALAGNFGQQVIVDNRGGNAAIPAQIVAHAPADGYTLLFHGNGFWLQGYLQDDVPYDVIKQFSPITLAASSPSILLVQPSFPVKSVKDLIAVAKSRPGGLNYASGANGTQPHLSAELFRSMAGINIVRVPYKGSASAISALMGGEVQFMFAPAAAAAPHIRPGGRLKALAVTSERASALFPELPTVASAGLPGYGSELLVVVFAPAGTPAAVINRLNQEMVRDLNRADVKEQFANVGVEPVAGSPGELAARMKSEMARWGKIIRDAGIRAE